MKTIKELEKGCGKFKLGKVETCRKEDLCLECQIKIKTIKDVLKLIDKKIRIHKKNITYCKDKTNKDYDELEIPIYEGKIYSLEYLKIELMGNEDLQTTYKGRILCRNCREWDFVDIEKGKTIREFVEVSNQICSNCGCTLKEGEK